VHSHKSCRHSAPDLRTKKALFFQGSGSGAYILIFARGHAAEHQALDLAKWPFVTGLLGLQGYAVLPWELEPARPSAGGCSLQ
jgi:hypothetical protein